ncbi:hypothetical protein [Amycolatopsis sp. cmx-11-51]|uniref:hypothetical protein n=1 Tax=unclassified Amycolatopsis TaxID=2618356 RepID=UPI0039E3C3CE
MPTTGQRFASPPPNDRGRRRALRRGTVLALTVAVELGYPGAAVGVAGAAGFDRIMVTVSIDGTTGTWAPTQTTATAPAATETTTAYPGPLPDQPGTPAAPETTPATPTPSGTTPVDEPPGPSESEPLTRP